MPLKKISLSKKFRTIFQRATYIKICKRILLFLEKSDMLSDLIIRNRMGAWFVGLIIPETRPVLCSACFTDHGLKFDAEKIGIYHGLPCPNCATQNAKKLTPHLLDVLASKFFVKGSFHRSSYGGAPRIQFNQARFQSSDYEGPDWLKKDVCLISDKGRIGLFHYGPRLWMLGYIEPLEALQDESKRDNIISRILKEYPSQILAKQEILYRLRRDPQNPALHTEYDSPRHKIVDKERGRLDSQELSVFYCSQDIEGCIHECRVTVEDELYLAILRPKRDLKLLNLTALLPEGVSEFESLDMAVHMLFFAAGHSYEITRAIAIAARNAGFDGLLYPSYFSPVRSGAIPFETAYGFSIRQFPSAAKYATSGIFMNIGLFGQPVKDGELEVTCINRLVLDKVHYDFHFGPVPETDR